MSREQRKALDALLRDALLDLGGELEQQRQVLEEMLGSTPLPGDADIEQVTLGGVPAIRLSTAHSQPGRVILYLHGGAYALESARTGLGLAYEIARRTRSVAYSVEYRLAPEHPYPAITDCLNAYRALIDEGTGPAQIAIVGESAGAGLVAAALLRIRTAGLPQPACVAMMSPWADLTPTSDTLHSKAAVDPVLTLNGLRRRRDEYVSMDEAREASPVYDDLSGLAPAVIQAGSHEILLDDAITLAGRIAAGNGRVDLQIWPEVPHVFQGFASMLQEGAQALDALASFIEHHTHTERPIDLGLTFSS